MVVNLRKRPIRNTPVSKSDFLTFPYKRPVCPLVFENVSDQDAEIYVCSEAGEAIDNDRAISGPFERRTICTEPERILQGRIRFSA